MIVFNGEVLCITFKRDILGFEASGIEIRKWHTGELLASHPWAGGMGCAIVHHGEIHIFGNTNWRNIGNKLIHSVLGPDFTPSPPAEILTGPFRFYNTDICRDAYGFRMVVEVWGATYFARSRDLVSWEFHGGQLAQGQYIGCPTIDFIGGVHYMTWLSNVGTPASPFYVTQVARSRDDCFTFEYGRTILSPDHTEQNNASDFEYVEYGGEVLGLYLNGNQLGIAATRTVKFPGTAAEMLQGAF